VSRLRILRLLPLLVALLALPGLSCRRGGYPGAPEGHNFRTAQVVWKLGGTVQGTSELYLETKGYKDGRLLYKRYAAKTDLVVPNRAPGGGTRAYKSWVFNVEGNSYSIAPEARQAVKSRLNTNQMLALRRFQTWREVLALLIPRADLTPDQKRELQRKVANMQDEDLLKVGAKITNDTFMGHKVKRYDIPVANGRASLWMYGDIPLKEDIRIRRGNITSEKTMAATKFILNERLPEEPFTVPKGYKIIDRTKKIEEH
jgi:hypothetical protein